MTEDRPTHYTLASRFERTKYGLDATVVVVCDDEVRANHWFTTKVSVVTCARCREFFLRPHGRAYRFIEGSPDEDLGLLSFPLDSPVEHSEAP